MPGLNDDVCHTVLGQRALGSVARERRYIPPYGRPLNLPLQLYREHLVGAFGPLHDPPQRHMKQFPSGLLVAALLVASGLMWAVMFFRPVGASFAARRRGDTIRHQAQGLQVRRGPRVS